MSKWVYAFGDGQAEGDGTMRNLLGGKGANLAEMSQIGLPVPPGFTISTDLCTWYNDNDENYPADLKDQVGAALKSVESVVGSAFGDAANPLLVSVRSGARASMPGMMDTVLNLGLNDDTVEGLALASGDARFAWDTYRRFIQMYGDVVLGIDHYRFETLLEDLKAEVGVTLDTDMAAGDWKELVNRYKDMVARDLGAPFPLEPNDQLWRAISAVFGSWMNQRAKTYRRLHGISDSWGTAVNVQAMVFGNMGDDCATGVAFTRDPSTGENRFYGEYLMNAQGEDVVAGIRTPQNLTIEGKLAQGSDDPAMEEAMPEIFGQLDDVRAQLEAHYTDIQDIEFTVQKGKLWMLQTRAAKRTVHAAIKIAVDMVEEGLISSDEAICRINASQLDQLLHPTLDPSADVEVFARGLPASPGAACGIVVFSADEAVARAQEGEDVILARSETSPEDIHGMHAARAILTTRGGMTSHAAVVARGMGRPCVAGAGEVRIDHQAQTMTCGGRVVSAGEKVTIDGASGTIILGDVPTLQPTFSDGFRQIMTWADARRRMRVRTNAETPADVSAAREFGAEGIGLCRTEHMFFDADRIVAVRQMIMAETEAGRREALDRILPMQRADFDEIFRIMVGFPVTIRLLDPPLHEFLPQTEEEMAEVALAASTSVEDVKRRAAKLEEANPMLGHRGCRLAVTYPEICEMQARAVFEAAIDVAADTGQTVVPEVMIPLVATKAEIDVLKKVIDGVAADVSAARGKPLDYMIGTMIELPRAALRAGAIAESAEFFSFGTNDLTQTTFGLSRDDAGQFLGVYLEKGIFDVDPFISLDREGVGELVEIAVERGRKTRPDIKLGICGEHGGDPDSIEFCEQVGLDYVSCSPFRVPIARLAAAQSTIRAEKQA